MRSRFTGKAVVYRTYKVYSNEGTPKVYFDNKYVGRISNGSISVSLPYKSSGYQVRLEEVASKSPSTSIVIGFKYSIYPYKVSNNMCSGLSSSRYMDFNINSMIGLGTITDRDFNFSINILPADLNCNESYTPITSGICKSSLTLNYSSSRSYSLNKTTQFTGEYSSYHKNMSESYNGHLWLDGRNLFSMANYSGYNAYINSLSYGGNSGAETASYRCSFTDPNIGYVNISYSVNYSI